jgi:hypothetical protein
MDILSGKSSFYKIENFFKDKDVELLLGKKWIPKYSMMIMLAV